jgi:hypothetical protein
VKPAVVFLTTAALAAAQEFPEYSNAMKAADAAAKVLDKLEKKTGPQAVRAAEILGGVFEQTIGFWRQRNASDAVKWSEQGKAAAAQLAAAAHAGDAERAATAFKEAVAACNSCHEVWRTKTADGGYAIVAERARRPGGKKKAQ